MRHPLKRMGSHTSQVLGATGLALCVFASGQALAADKEAVIGFAVAKSGMFQPYDEEGIDMAGLFIERQNEKGGLLGHQLKPIVVDTKSDRVEGAKAGTAVLEQGAQLVVVTCDYDFGAPAALQANKAKVIAVSLCAGDPKMGPIGVGPYVFSAGMAAQSEGATLANWAYNEKGYRNAYLLTDTLIEYTKSACSGFEWQWEQNGGKFAGKDTFKGGDPSVAAQITRLDQQVKKGDVDVIMMCTVLPGGATVLRQIRSAGIDTPVLSGQPMAGTFWMDAVPNLSNFYTTQQGSVVNDPRESVQEVARLYKEKMGKDINQVSVFAIYAWLELWAKAVEEAGTFDSDKVLAIMNTYKDEPTFLGPYSFTPRLHIQDAPQQVVVEVQDAKVANVQLTKRGEPLPEDLLYRIKK